MDAPSNLNGYDPTQHDGSYYYDAVAAEKPVSFFEQVLTHTKGQLARRKLQLEPWQADFFRTLYGWRCKDTGYRRYRTAVFSAGRGNGKTTIAAGVGLYMLGFCDKEHGVEAYISASNREQAEKTYEIASAMVRQSSLKGRFTCLDSRKRILFPKRNGYLCTTTSESSSAEGFNSFCCLADELHVWEGQRGREFFHTLQSGLGKRPQSLMLITSTAGFDRTSIFWDVWNLCMRCKENPATDYSLLPLIYAADPGDDPYDESTWYKANPNIGRGVDLSYLRTQAKRAQTIPSFENEFLRKHLNIWTEQFSAFLKMSDVLSCPTSDDIPLDKEYCVAGIDTSSTTDLSCIALYWPKLKALRVWSFIPGDSARQRSLLDGVDYPTWLKNPAANLTFAGTKRIDRQLIFDKAIELSKRYKVLAWAFDPWETRVGVISDLQKRGLRMIEYGQGYAQMNSPTKEFEMMIVNHTLNIGNNPLLRWSMQNLSVKELHDLIRPVKTEDAKRIDPCVASIMAIGISKSVNPVGIAC